MNRKRNAFFGSIVLLCSLILFPTIFYAEASATDTEYQYSEVAAIGSGNENLYPSNLAITNFKGESVNSGILKITKGSTIQLYYSISYYGTGDVEQLSVECSSVDGISTIITNTGNASGNISLTVAEEFSSANASILFSVIGGATTYSQRIMLEEVPAEENENIPPDLNTPTEPVNPHTNTPEEPVNPETNTPEKPASPDLNMPTKPVNPHTNTPEEPVNPETNTPEEPASPDLNMPTKPVNPHTNTPEEPVSPETNTPEEPASPDLNMPTKPVNPHTNTPEKPVVPEIDTPIDKTKPDSSMQEKLAVQEKRGSNIKEMKRSSALPYTGEERNIWDLLLITIGCSIVLWSMKGYRNYSR